MRVSERRPRESRDCAGKKICRVAQPRLRDATDTIRDQGLLITTVEILSFQVLPTDGVSAVY